MQNIRSVLVIALLFVSYLIWDAWQRDYGPRPTPAVTTDLPAQNTATDTPVVAGEMPALPNVDAATRSTPVEMAGTLMPALPTIKVRTDVLSLEIDPKGAQIIGASLLAYPIEKNEPDVPFELLGNAAWGFHVAQTGLRSANPAPDHNALYQSSQPEWKLSEGQDRLEVPFVWRDASGIEVTLTYVFERGSYLIKVRHQILNGSGDAWVGQQYRQLQRTASQVAGGFFVTNPESFSYNGAAFYDPVEKLEKLPFDEFAEWISERAPGAPLAEKSTGGWIGMLQHYFFAGWIPPKDEASRYELSELKPPGMSPRYLVRSLSPVSSVAPNETRSLEASLYLGPKLQNELPKIAEGLELTVDYGIFTIFSQLLFWLLNFFHSLVGNWGLAIIMVTIVIKLVFFKLSEAQYRSMAKMRKIQPRLEQLKERYGDDRQKYAMAQMELFKKEKINPLGGCLPILVQIPVFIALYWVLVETVELRQAPFMLWITDLSAADPYFVLPILNAAAMILTQKLTPMVGMDPMQRKIMQTMPVVFSVMFAFFPAGLVLYWTVNGFLGLAQQWLIMKRVDGAKAA